MRPVQCFLLFALVFLIGCGGSGSSSSGGGVTPTILVDWPQRTRDFYAPASALSATFVLTPALPSAPETLTINRGTTLTAFNQSYSFPAKLQPGSVQFAANFFSEADGQGVVVATATGTCTVDSTAPLFHIGVITTVQTITSVSVNTVPTINLGTSQQLTFTAYNANNEIVAVTPGSASWSQTGGALTLTPDGIATGSAVGTSLVWATVDLVSSAHVSAPVGIISNSNYSLLAIDLSELVSNSADGKLYGLTTSSDTNYPNSLVQINPLTSLVVNHVSFSNPPNCMGLSSDGSVLYVGTSVDGQVHPVSLPNLSLGTAFAAYPSSLPITPVDISVMPGQPGTIAVSFASADPCGVKVFDNGVARSNWGVGANQQSDSVAFNSSGTLLFGTFGEIYQVSGQGLTEESTRVPTGLLGSSLVRDYNGHLYGSSGAVCDETTGVKVGNLGIGTNFSAGSRSVCVNQDFTKAYLLGTTEAPGFPVAYAIDDPATFAQSFFMNAGIQGMLTQNVAVAAPFGESGFAYYLLQANGPGTLVIIQDATKGLSNPVSGAAKRAQVVSNQAPAKLRT